MKKRILICSHWMEIGGAERALLGLLYSLDYTKYDVDLYLCRHSGEFMSMIPPEVHLLPEDKHAASIAIPAKEALKKGCFVVLAGRTWAKFKTRLYERRHLTENSCVAIEYSNRYTYRSVKKINPDIVYDLAISFLEPHYIAAYRVQATQKIAWMHTDYSHVGVDREEGYRVWGKFDRIVAISADCGKAFMLTYPKLKDKLIQIENILSAELILKQAEAFDVMDEMPTGSINLLSVGRFCPAKNFDNIPEICAQLVQFGLNVRWYLIGYGGCEEEIRRKIVEFDMQDRVVILGKKKNPYPYIKACDLYVQPSRYEGKCVTVREAQVLGKPVVITNYATAPSQLENGVDGIVVPMDNDGCAKGIAALLADPDKMVCLAETCRSRDYSNAEEVQKLYQLLED